MFYTGANSKLHTIVHALRAHTASSPEAAKCALYIFHNRARMDSVAKSSEGRELAELRGLLRGDAEQLADEFDLGYHISFAGPLTLPFWLT